MEQSAQFHAAVTLHPETRAPDTQQIGSYVGRSEENHSS
jgi:hypothetical protein